MMIYARRKHILREERLWETFCKLDTNGDGVLTIEEVKETLSPEEMGDAQAVFNEIDVDGNGKIDYFEFIDLFLAKDDETNIPLTSSSSTNVLVPDPPSSTTTTSSTPATTTTTQTES